MAKIKTVKFKILDKGEIKDFQSVIEERFGMEISKLSCYDANNDCKSEINGERVDSDRAYFVPDCDYEVIIRPIKRK